MKSAAEREQEFRDDWQKLLDKHGAETEWDRDTGRLCIVMYTVPGVRIRGKTLELDYIIGEEHCEFSL